MNTNFAIEGVYKEVSVKERLVYTFALLMGLTIFSMLGVGVLFFVFSGVWFFYTIRKEINEEYHRLTSTDNQDKEINQRYLLALVKFIGFYHFLPFYLFVILFLNFPENQIIQHIVFSNAWFTEYASQNLFPAIKNHQEIYRGISELNALKVQYVYSLIFVSLPVAIIAFLIIFFDKCEFIKQIIIKNNHSFRGYSSLRFIFVILTISCLVLPLCFYAYFLGTYYENQHTQDYKILNTTKIHELIIFYSLLVIGIITMFYSLLVPVITKRFIEGK